MTEQQIPRTKRLFIAVMLPRDVQDTLAKLVGLLDAHRSILRPVRPEALHFTLRFLGETPAPLEQAAAQACAAATRDVAPFALGIGGFGTFPNARRPRVIWLGLRDGAAPLIALQRRLDDELLRRHVVTDRDDFTPHLTLARVRQEAPPAARAALGAALAALPNRESARCSADAISLVHSTLTAHGSHYAVVGAWPGRDHRPEDPSG